MKKIALISSFCDTEEKVEILLNNILTLKKLGLDVLVLSPIPLTEEVIKKSDYVFFTKENPLLVWPVRDFTFWKIFNSLQGTVRVHRNMADYGWASLYQVKKLSQIALTFDYDIFYHMIYDLEIDDVVKSAIYDGQINIIFPRINPNNLNEIWEATLHFMIFDREKLKEIESRLSLETYLNDNGVAEGQALKWSKEVPLKISEKPVKDKIYYWGKQDMFNYSSSKDYKIFISKNEETQIWKGEPLRSETLSSKFKIFLYDFEVNSRFEIKINSNTYIYQLKGNELLNFDIESHDVESLIVLFENIPIDYTETFKKIHRNLIYLF